MTNNLELISAFFRVIKPVRKQEREKKMRGIKSSEA